MSRSSRCLRARCRTATLLLAVLAALGGCSDPHAKFAGIWKSNCADFWGVQIKPVGDGIYAVTFCGLAGCMAPGKWMPNTRLVGDPMYEIQSPTRIGIKRNQSGHFAYSRCTTDPTWPEASAPG